jgi:hypothetical protein
MGVMKIAYAFIVVSGVVGLSGCANIRPSVRNVDISEAPELTELALRARQIGNQNYPKVLTLLPDPTSKLHRRFDIVFKKKIDGNAGQTIGTTIYLNGAWYGSNALSLELDLTHEMAHVAQQHSGEGPWYWTEGLAAYVCYKLGYTNGPTGPQVQPTTPHYTTGYWCTGAFLVFLDQAYGQQAVQRLNVELRRNSYSDQMFTEATGKNLDHLWKEFQRTPAYKPPNKSLQPL